MPVDAVLKPLVDHISRGSDPGQVEGPRDRWPAEDLLQELLLGLHSKLRLLAIPSRFVRWHEVRQEVEVQRLRFGRGRYAADAVAGEGRFPAELGPETP